MHKPIKISENRTNNAPPPTQELERKVAKLLLERNGDLPVWVRAPKQGAERYTGLTRGMLYQLASAGKIKSASLRKPGQLRGCRLFSLPSLLAFIESCALPESSK